ncbi:MFS transporter [Pseudomonas sp. G11-1]|uniref:MFS transporter n=1 Tax=Halopseudomonas bauzanensis TaxID=653930 RepID=A0A031M0C3_9GAMM|nr:MFS transporter [Halopseudomonas bauzanensis]MCO5784893.1 MFS transporter [Pseudomonas sp. G11-1]MCO5789004.1 MFS transporter [Pseudomonas sp. G11-2]EZQ14042.1 MFS transporter [Halopseudomonas bauzanensis]TKA90910.1 MFS transporter [Halopseudomonas bauzanensis]SER62104.1 Na+/melibiose symporter [Halopseudomonas bauzanensis]
MSQSGILKRSTILVHGSVGIPLAIIGYPLAVYLPPFYAQEMGLNMALMALVLVLARFSDVITDPLVGMISDRWQTRFGRRKPWLIMGTPLMLLGTVMIFMPPEGAGIMHLMGWTILMYLGWTMVTLPYGAWGAELSTLYHQRSRVTASREGFILLGLFIAALAPAIVQALGARYAAGDTDSLLMRTAVWLVGRDGELGIGYGPILASMGWLLLILLPITVLLVVTCVREAPPRSVQRTDWKKGLRVLKNNGPFKRLMLILLIVITGESFRNAMSVFFMQHVIQIQAHIGMMYLLYFGIGILGIPFWLALGRRIGKHRAFCVAVGISSLSILGMFFLQAGQLLPFAIMFAIKGFCFAAFQFLPLSMLADIVDLDTARSKEHRTGLFFAMSGMAQKMAMAVGLGLSLGLLALVGFDATQTVHSEQQLMSLRVLYIIGPVLMYMAAFMLARRYPLTSDRQERIRQWIQRRNVRLQIVEAD